MVDIFFIRVLQFHLELRADPRPLREKRGQLLLFMQAHAPGQDLELIGQLGGQVLYLAVELFKITVVHPRDRRCELRRVMQVQAFKQRWCVHARLLFCIRLNTKTKHTVFLCYCQCIRTNAEETRMPYYRRLYDLREDHDLKQREVAAVLGITRPQYSLYERGVRDLPTTALITLARLYKTSTDYLLGLTDDPTPRR